MNHVSLRLSSSSSSSVPRAIYSFRSMLSSVVIAIVTGDDYDPDGGCGDGDRRTYSGGISPITF